MADVAVSSLVRTLGEFLIEQIKFLQGVRDEVQSLKDEWKYMLAFLKDAEEKQVESHNIKQWVSDIIVAAYDAEAIIDEFIIKFEEEEEEEEEEEGHIACFTAWFRKCFCIYKEVAKQADLYEIGKEIKKLKDKLDEIEENRKKYEITNIGGAGEGKSTRNDRFKELRREPFFDEGNEHVVGFKEDADKLMSELLKEMSDRCVISIVGMGGLGKTTMARKLYNNSTVRKEFENRSAWVSVSKDYNIPNLLRRIIKSFKVPATNEELEKMEIEDLECHLRDFLQESRYLVVIDDVWDKDAWASLRRALPENNKGSRVIITTRKNDVAENTFWDKKYVHNLPFLREEESWELFCKKVVQGYDGVDDKTSRCLSGLKEDVLKKCHGLPLAIVVLGGLLSKKHPDDWPELKYHIWRHVRGVNSESVDSTHVGQILALSFNDLPHHLKSCFLYLGMFPEDFEIDVDKLIRLWVAEDFIQRRDGEGLEETAMEYLKELIDRNLIQISKRCWRRIKSCRVHDLLRDFAIEKSKELNFLHIYDGNGYSTLSPTRRRRLASHTGGLKRFDSFDHSSNLHLRTLLFFNSEDESAKIEELQFLYTKLRLLRVLDLEDIEFGPSEDTEQVRLLDGIGKLIHLRYLGLNHTKINKLPPSIGKLHALQTLEISTIGESIMLPEEICNAKQLRHLIGSFKWPFHVKNLTNLRTLNCVEVDDRMEFNPLTDLINLHELHVFFNGESKLFTLDSIGRLRSLQTLYLLESNNDNWFPTLQPLSHCQHLLQLRLYGITGKLPTEMHEILPNLKYLCLDGSRMEEDPMPSLEKLPKLTILDLSGYNGIKLVCTTGGFPQLEILQLIGGSVKELQVSEGGMPALWGLSVPDGVSIPEKLRSIPASKNWDYSGLNDWPY